MAEIDRQLKRDLRARMLHGRLALDAYALSRAARHLRDEVLAIPEVAAARVLAAYVSVGREPGTGPLLDALYERGVEVLLPLLEPDGDLSWAAYAGPGALASAGRGMLEPTGPSLGRDAVLSATVVLVPGIAVDSTGVRLGRGGGSYDRVLARVGLSAFTCVLLHEGEIIDLLVPREPHDVGVLAAATPSRVRRFGWSRPDGRSAPGR